MKQRHFLGERGIGVCFGSAFLAMAMNLPAKIFERALEGTRND
jgi:hypothetical protein